MRKFTSVNEYLSALEKNPALAVVSISMAADSRNVGKATITRQLKDKQFEPIVIDGVTHVLASELIAAKRKDEDNIKVVRAELEEYARKGKSVYYETIMRSIGLDHQTPRHRTLIGGILGVISEQTWEEKGVLLSVLVHKKTAGTTRPSDGFFELVEGVGHGKWAPKRKDFDIDAFIEDEMHAVWEKYGAK